MKLEEVVDTDPLAERVNEDYNDYDILIPFSVTTYLNQHQLFVIASKLAEFAYLLVTVKLYTIGIYLALEDEDLVNTGSPYYALINLF